jgi:hypothetical protein
MSTTAAGLGGATTQTITVTKIPSGALEFITARVGRQGGSVQVWEFPNRGVTEIGFTHPSDPKRLQACQLIVAEWCAANFPGVPLLTNVPGRHRRRS